MSMICRETADQVSWQLGQETGLRSWPPRSPATPATKLLFTVTEAAAVLSMSRASLYRLIRGGEVPTLKIGAMTRVTAAALDSYVSSLQRRATQGSTWPSRAPSFQRRVCRTRPR